MSDGFTFADSSPRHAVSYDRDKVRILNEKGEGA